MDKLRLDMKAVDELQEDVKDLLVAMNRLNTIIPPDFEGKQRVQSWLDIFKNMTASEELTPEQVRQLTHDLETAYNAFQRLLHDS
jgi:ESCRT-I complex subunit VPS28